MTDRAVLIPTSEGAVGGVVSEPRGEPRAAVLLLPGHGRPARSGVNSFWTRIARSLADQGLVALRIDYSREGETLPIGQGKGGLVWKRDLDLRLLEQAAPWFRERAPGAPFLLAGACAGARLAIELAGRNPDAVAGTFLIVPYIKDLPAVARRLEDGAAEPLPDASAVDPLVLYGFQRILAGAPSWILVGEHDDLDLPQLRQRLDPTPYELDVDVVPSAAIHLLDQPHLQEEVGRRLLARIAVRLSQLAPTSSLT